MCGCVDGIGTKYGIREGGGGVEGWGLILTLTLPLY